MLSFELLTEPCWVHRLKDYGTTVNQPKHICPPTLTAWRALIKETGKILIKATNPGFKTERLNTNASHDWFGKQNALYSLHFTVTVCMIYTSIGINTFTRHCMLRPLYLKLMQKYWTFWHIMALCILNQTEYNFSLSHLDPVSGWVKNSW